MKQKSMYRVFDWNTDGSEEYYEKHSDAVKRYKQLVKDEPKGNWRLYKDTEKPHMSGNFTEECLISNGGE